MADRKPAGPRCAALVGPYLSGKTSLLESLLSATGAIPRKGYGEGREHGRRFQRPRRARAR